MDYYRLPLRTSVNTARLVALWLVAAALLLTSTGIEAKSGVRIYPEPNGEVGLMISESKYFQCMGSNSGKEKLVWLDPHGNEINNDANNRIYTTLRKNILKLDLKSPTKADSGVYKCVSRNEQNKEISSEHFKLYVFNPTVVQGTNNYLKSEGTRVVMECIASSDKSATVEFTWKFGNFDLSQDPQKYRIETIRENSRNPLETRVLSRLEIQNVTKEHDGNYVCEVDTTNKFISDSKELRITLHVQYKPRFDEKTPRYIWISEEAVQQGGPLSVNISCIVYADPVSKITWNYHDNRPVHPNKIIGNVRAQISDSENMSILTLTYRNIDEIKKPHSNSRIKYTCVAQNSQGTARNTFEIKVGRIPDSPQIVSIDYKEGSIVLALNESQVEPPIDIYRLEIASGELAYLFNKSNAKENANNTYVIELNLPKGEHKVNIFAHNPVGWSENPYSSYFLSVVSGSGSLTASWATTLTLVALCQLALFKHGLVGATLSPLASLY